ncbi:hypothetical protein QGM71_08155 [Virgibacillus sp. C22-A2]|uniref:Uncharacterized protein n=1 Tax=Virgibacillus tibetensis TaxID=3042313 RepID=A0ABU6KGA8_9BACI|nr:hypothetical protein [Virgibacillus sp. C22-A2]
MKLKLLFILSICVVIISIVYILNLLNQDFVLSKEDDYKSTISVWITTPGLASTLEQFQTESNIKVNVRKFSDVDSLLEELNLSAENREGPDVVEMNSNYGMMKS